MVRIGIDLGGTKIAGIILRDDGTFSDEIRIATPRDNYAGTLRAVAGLVSDLAAANSDRESATVGVAIPGSTAPGTGLIQNANSTWLNGRPFEHDLGQALKLPVRLANDANCFVLSEVADGAAAGASIVFGVILGTGCGGGIVIDGKLVKGPRGIGGEWGHNPLPWPEMDEVPGPPCWCGLNGCIETWISGPGLSRDFLRLAGRAETAEQVAELAAAGDPQACQALARHVRRTGRAIAHVVNILDPEVIVIGGGLSSMPHLYERLPEAIRPFVFASDRSVEIRPPRWGSASGVRGAARLWP